jgi:beta-galactosidase
MKPVKTIYTSPPLGNYSYGPFTGYSPAIPVAVTGLNLSSASPLLLALQIDNNGRNLQLPIDHDGFNATVHWSTGKSTDIQIGASGLLADGAHSPGGAAVAQGDTTHVVAVRVHSPGGTGKGGKPGGLCDTGAPDERSGPFDAGASPGQRQTGYTVGGTGWYRKTFTLAAGDKAAASGLRHHLTFDGVYMNADVWLNGHHLGTHPYGYTTFSYDVTAYLSSTATNVLAVRVRNEGSNSRWYSGSGIYRHVWLSSRAAVDIAEWGLGVTTPVVDLAAKTATVQVSVTLDRAGGSGSSTAVTSTVRASIYPPGAAAIAAADPSVRLHGQSSPTVGPIAVANGTCTIAAGQNSSTVVLSALLTDVLLWSTAVSEGGSANLYSVVVEAGASHADIDNEGTAVAQASNTFGVRTISFDAKGGFKLNGEALKLKGGCVHHDNGPLGSKAIDRADERRVQNLKNNGYNAIRTSHNPVSPAFLDACDRLGVVVMDEAFDCWSGGKNAMDYHLYFTDWWQRDVRSMVMRDRNHPSIVMWSIGNEIPIRKSTDGIRLAHVMSDFIRSLDPTCIARSSSGAANGEEGTGMGRAVTSAYPGVGGDNTTDAYLAALDVSGYNYGWSRYTKDHKRVPDRIMAGTESFPHQSFDTWAGVMSNDWVIGDFIWTAIDYIGESAIGANGHNSPGDINACTGYCPNGYGYHVSFCGDLDIVGHRKPQSYYRSVLWNHTQLALAVHSPVAEGETEAVASWGWPDYWQSWSWVQSEQQRSEQQSYALQQQSQALPPLTVQVYSRYPLVDLILNGNTISSTKTAVSEKTQWTATFTVPFAPGTLTAVGYMADGTKAEETSLKTAGVAHHIELKADRDTIRAGGRWSS